METVRSADGTLVAFWRSGDGPALPDAFVREVLRFLEGP